jgi:hypothetical protein
MVRLFSDEEIRQSKSDGEGRFDFPSLLPGKYKLVATRLGFKSAVIENIDIGLTAPEPLTITLNVGSGRPCPLVGPAVPLTSSDGTALLEGPLQVGADISYEKRLGKLDLSGEVHNAYWAPLPNVAVELTGMHESHSAVSNSNGAFEFSGVGQGQYVLRTSLEGYWGIPMNVWITRGNLTKVKIILPDHGSVGCFKLSDP